MLLQFVFILCNFPVIIITSLIQTLFWAGSHHIVLYRQTYSVSFINLCVLASALDAANLTIPFIHCSFKVPSFLCQYIVILALLFCIYVHRRRVWKVSVVEWLVQICGSNMLDTYRTYFIMYVCNIC